MRGWSEAEVPLDAFVRVMSAMKHQAYGADLNNLEGIN